MSRDFMIGYAAALAEIIRLHQSEVEVADTVEGHGFTMSDFERAGVEDYDLEVLRMVIREPKIMGPSHGHT